MEPSLGWGISWGDSWGSSWGPLHEVAEPTGWDTSQGKAGTNPPQKDYLAENLRRQREARDRQSAEEYNLTRLHQDDRLATEFLLALVTKGFLDA